MTATVTVSYACPHCGALTHVERRVELDDKSVTRSPQAGWEYATPADSPGTIDDADGIAFLCGEDERVRTADGEPTDGCGRPYYLNFVRFETGVELEPDPPAEGGPRFDFVP